MSEKRTEWVNNVMELKKKKDKPGVYLEVKKDIVLKAGDMINVKDYAENLKQLADKGVITKERAEELYEKCGHFILQVCDAPPSKE